jgi:hypothetical protein
MYAHFHMIMLFLQLELEEAEPSTESEEFREQHEEVIHKIHSVQHYVIKFVSDLRQVGGFLQALQFTPPIRLTATI